MCERRTVLGRGEQVHRTNRGSVQLHEIGKVVDAHGKLAKVAVIAEKLAPFRIRQDGEVFTTKADL